MTSVSPAPPPAQCGCSDTKVGHVTVTVAGAEDADYDVIIPHIQSPATGGSSDASPRIQNKCLSTWGFSSTSFR